ncbi:MAG: hypothetical protein DMG13_10170 [Acidobacteria bacterium]|nr:MAG: hypothetical protein DMG13_10170 [Acidobacteriota bacterium]
MAGFVGISENCRPTWTDKTQVKSRRLRANWRKLPRAKRSPHCADGAKPSITSCCRDYRAGATINFEMDAADKDKQITTPLLVLWGTRGGCADRRISDGVAQIRAQPRDHRAARHRALHTGGDARAVFGSFLRFFKFFVA